MISKPAISVAAFAIAAGWAAPAQAQSGEADAIQRELEAMRAQMAAMAERIETLETQLEEASADTASAPASGEAEPVTDIAWNGAPEISGEGGWSFKPRGRLEFDAGFTSVPESTGRDDGFGNEVRRARLGVEGDIPGGFGYMLEADFAGNEVAVTDAYLSYADGPAEIVVGQRKTFQSLEELTSDLHTTFIERAAFTDAFGFERRLGIAASYERGIVLAQAGLFTDNIADTQSGNRGVSARLVAMPEVGGAQLHFGGSVSYNDLDDPRATIRYRQRPLVHFTSERFVDTGSLGGDSEFGYGLEGAAVVGPFHAAAETFWQQVERPGALADPTFFGGYAEIGYFLTRGDSRGYGGGTFDRIEPASPVGEGGFGAVQVNLRYDYLDLNDAGVIGGKQNGYFASLVWTLTDYTRFLVNYGRLQYEDAVHPAAGGDTSYGVDAFGVRAQLDF